MPSSTSKHSNSNSSNNKKQSKSKSRLPPSFPDTATTTAAEPQQLTSLIQQASQIFPSFISQSAFIAQITDVDSTNSTSKDAKIWLSEPSMVQSSLAPGSLVSVMKFILLYFLGLLSNYAVMVVYDFSCFIKFSF
jgi:hypothetical protein